MLKTGTVGWKRKHVLKFFLFEIAKYLPERLIYFCVHSANFNWASTQCQTPSEVLGIPWWKGGPCCRGAPRTHSRTGKATSAMPALTWSPRAFELFLLGAKGHLINVSVYISIIAPEGEYQLFSSHLYFVTSSTHIFWMPTMHQASF